MIQRFKLSQFDGGTSIAIVKAVETLTMVDRAFVDIAAGELVVEGEAEETAIRELVAAAGGSVEQRP